MITTVLRLGKETVAYGLAYAATNLFSMILLPLYTRVLTPADYGVVAIVSVLSTLVSIVITLGLDSAAARFYYDDEDDRRRTTVMASWFWCQFLVSAVAATLIICLSTEIASLISSSNDARNAVILAALALPLTAFRQVGGIWLRCRRLAARAAAFFTFSGLASVIASALLVLLLDQGVTGVFAGQLIGAIATAIVALSFIYRRINPLGVSRPVLGRMAVFGLPLVPAAMALWTASSSDRLVLNSLLDESDVGVYSVASSISAIVVLFTSGFLFAWAPFAYSLVQEKSSLNSLSLALSWFTFGACALAALTSIFASEIVAMLVTPEFYPAAGSVPFLAFGWVAMAIMSALAIGANIAKRTLMVAACFVIGALGNVVLTIVLVSAVGRDGAAIATLIAYILASILMYFLSDRYFRIPYRFSQIGLFAVWSAILTAIAALSSPTSSWPSLIFRSMLCLFLPLPLLFTDLIQRGRIRRVLSVRVLQQFRHERSGR